MASKDRYYIKVGPSSWIFRSPLIRVVNPILRAIQFWAQEPWVLVAVSSDNGHDRPHFWYYEFVRLPRT